ncbi:LuxR C-terminal-related transcriptional regulator [Actinomadura sp. 9N407]|uniref:LuxR C-terminal-related transcriptional regulator n=1 Tax=Actinomadura sp. 9N407 TaxID=3375154 RepID=UPI00379574CE
MEDGPLVRFPDDHGAAVEAVPDLVRLGISLVNAHDLDDFGRLYIDAVGGLVAGRAACYLVDAATERPRPVSARGVGTGYLQAYERFGRDRDPVHREALARRRAVADHLLMPADRWTELPVFREVFRPAGLARLMMVPVLAGDRLLGTLNFGRDRSAPPFDARELAVADTLAAIFGVAITGFQARLVAQRESAAVWEPLERGRDPLVLFASGLPPRPNAAARRLLAGIRDAAQALAALGDTRYLAGTGPARLPVTQDDGTPASLAGHPLQAGNGERTRIFRLRLDSGAAPVRPGSLGAPGGAGAPGAPGGSDRAAALAGLPAHVAAALTGREADVAALAGQGLRDTEIAQALHISVYTVKQHLKSAYGKLGVRSRVELTRLLGPPADGPSADPPPADGAPADRPSYPAGPPDTGSPDTSRA